MSPEAKPQRCPSCGFETLEPSKICPQCKKSYDSSKENESLTEEEQKILEERLRSLGYL